MYIIKLKPTLTYVIIVLLLGVSNVNGQTNKTNVLISAGYGEFEFLNLAAGMQIAQFAISLSAGYEPSEWRDKSLAISVNTFWHFGGESRHTDVRPWYFRPGIQYDSYSIGEQDYEDLFLYTRIGRQFNITKFLGVFIDGGIHFPVYETTNEIPCTTCENDEQRGPTAGFGTGVYFRI